MNPAARINDAHTCPKVEEVPGSCGTTKKPHVGGPIVGKCSSNVKINGKLAARVADDASCDAPQPKDMITTGAKTVKINGRLAAVVTSRTMHTGQITEGSPNVKIGGAVGGATLGDGDASTRACKAAAVGRGNKQNQSLPMNCGHEAVRTACIQKCGGCSPKGKDKSCEACDYSERDWYDRYFAPDDKGGMMTNHNDVNKKYEEEVRKRNEEKWAQLQKAPVVSNSQGKVDLKGKTWQDFQGQTLKTYQSEDDYTYNKNITPITIERLPSKIDPSTVNTPNSEKQMGTRGSFPETRQKMLAEWCGLKDTQTANNDVDSVTQGLADNKVVVASVDVGKLNNDPNTSGQHAVTITEMSFNDDGSIKEIRYTDTSQTDGCDKRLKGQEGADRLKGAMTKDAQVNLI